MAIDITISLLLILVLLKLYHNGLLHVHVSRNLLKLKPGNMKREVNNRNKCNDDIRDEYHFIVASVRCWSLIVCRMLFEIFNKTWYNFDRYEPQRAINHTASPATVLHEDNSVEYHPPAYCYETPPQEQKFQILESGKPPQMQMAIEQRRNCWEPVTSAQVFALMIKISPSLIFFFFFNWNYLNLSL